MQHQTSRLDFVTLGRIALGLCVVVIVVEIGFAIRLSGKDRETLSGFRGTPIVPDRVVGDFTLVDEQGNIYPLASGRKDATFYFFGYTHCPDECPATLGVLARAYQTLGSSASRVRVVFVTVDPQRDDPAHIREFLAHFDRRFKGLSGQPEVLERVYRSFGVTAQVTRKTEKSAGEDVRHSASLYLADREGRLLLEYPPGVSAGDVVHDVRLLLARE